jgi:hypothetical protein
LSGVIQRQHQAQGNAPPRPTPQAMAQSAEKCSAAR